MTALDRRAFMATTAVCVATPTALGAKECPTMDWITMSLEARNLAYNNVEHVGPENARKKTEGWAAASKTLREQRSQHLDLAYGNGERNKWDLYPANDPKAPCFVHIHGGYWQRGSKEIFACLSEGSLARGWSAALCGYTLAPEATLTQITNELKSAFDWLNAKADEHGIQGPIIVTGWSEGGHLTSFILDHPKVADQPIKEVARLMSERDIGALPVGKDDSSAGTHITPEHLTHDVYGCRHRLPQRRLRGARPASGCEIPSRAFPA